MSAGFSAGSYRNPQGQGYLGNSPFVAPDSTGFGESGLLGRNLVHSHHGLARGVQHARYGHDSGQYGVESTTLASQVSDDTGDLGLVAKEAMLVLRLKNAITNLIDVVGLYDAAEFAMGSYAGSYRQATRDAIDYVSMVTSEIDPRSMIDEDRATSDLLKISSALGSFEDRWEEVYPSRRHRDRANRSSHLREDENFDSGQYVAELKKILHPSKLRGVVKAATWLQNVERDLRKLRSQHIRQGTPAAARRQGHRYLY